MARRRRPRVNSMLLWGGRLGFALVCALYGASWHNAWGVSSPIGKRAVRLTLWRGQLGLVIYRERDAMRSYAWRGPAAEMIADGWPRYPLGPSWGAALGQSYGSIPLWPLLPVCAASAMLAAHRRAKEARMPLLCSSCRYDLSGLPPASPPLPCPECGAKPPNH